MSEVCSVCGAPLSGDFGGSRGDTYASYTCSHGPTSDYDYDRGTGKPGAPTVDSANFSYTPPERIEVLEDRQIRELEAKVRQMEKTIAELKAELERGPKKRGKR